MKFFTPTGKPIKRVGLYARVSDKQQEDTNSLSTQLKMSRDFSARHNLEVIAEKSAVISGAFMWEARTKFNELLTMGSEGLIDAIVADVTDRLGRGDALSTLVNRARRQGLEVLFDEYDGPISHVQMGVDMLVSGGERKRISERVKKNKLEAAEKGKIVFSTPPYGLRIIRTYDPHTGKKIHTAIEFDPEEVQQIIDIFTWFVRERESIRGIGRRLYEDEALPPGLKKKMLKRYGEEASWDKVPEKWEKSKEWHASTIRRLLQNETYVGRWWFNRRETKLVETRDGEKQATLGTRDKDAWVCIEIEPIISEAVFEQAQVILRKNRLLAGRPPKHESLLRGMLFCSCGRKMAGSGKDQHGCYRCTRNISTVQKCQGSSYLSEALVDRLVWEYIQLVLIDPDMLLEEYERKQQEAEKENAILLEQAEALQASIHKAKVKTDNLLDLLLDKDIDKQTYKHKKKQIEDTIEDTREELARVEARLHRETLTEDHKRQFSEFCASAWEILKREPGIDEKRQILRKLDVKVTHLDEKNALLIQGTFPTVELEYKEQYLPFAQDPQAYLPASEKVAHRRLCATNLTFAAVLPLAAKTRKPQPTSIALLPPNHKQLTTVQKCGV